MKCERLRNLVKTWYFNVQEETMAPARMMTFINKHVSQCEDCLVDPDIKFEVRKIKEIVLPSAKEVSLLEGDGEVEEVAAAIEYGVVDEEKGVEDELLIEDEEPEEEEEETDDDLL